MIKRQVRYGIKNSTHGSKQFAEKIGMYRKQCL